MSSFGDRRPEPPSAAPPIQMLEGFLDFLRATLLWKLEGLSDEALHRTGTPSGVSLIKLVKHSAGVERWWFQMQMAGLEVQPPWSKDDPDADWRIDPGETCDGIISQYKTECDRSREILASFSWDDLAKGERGISGGLTVGWIVTHMVEEVARHCGHADILREAIDGATGE